MKTMVDVAIEYLNSHGQDNFENIFTAVKKEFQEKWQNEAKKNNLTMEEILVKKTGEFYKLLTVYAKFTHLGNNEWDLSYIEK
ncbi:DNA-directed RNA polymerase subunit delta [Mycoplasma elephantis]|uniref:DNA-directed RNA polymerase subunit delta n=1 Tax=Mycoplasma elephantis TaxID=114882 RepID=UPI0004822A5B|nr:hypothetical protein [Mycoplasma elephantis]